MTGKADGARHAGLTVPFREALGASLRVGARVRVLHVP